MSPLLFFRATVLAACISVGSFGKAQTWNLGGNTVNSDSRIGTNNGWSLLFETGDVERMRLDANGRFGINTTGLTARFNVYQSQWADWMSLQNSVGKWNLHNNNSQDALVFYYLQNGQGQSSKQVLTLATNGTVMVGDGYSGIPHGTRFAIKQGWNDWAQFFRRDALVDPDGYFRIHNPQDQNRMMFFYTDGFGVNSPALSLWSNGKVSIGTEQINTNSDYKLYVATGILTEKVKVALTTSAQWADHVFAPNYALMPLDNVREYIECHRHLPGVPSADEMVAGGVDMVKTDAMLLAKVEELTLYILELEKRLRTLEGKGVMPASGQRTIGTMGTHH